MIGAIRTVPIVHATSRFVVLDKPAGVLSVPGKGEEKADCVVSRIRAMFPGATGPMVVHRLDMDTSGLLVIALDEDAQRELSDQFACRVVEKSYIALLDGSLAVDQGVIDLPMRADINNRPMQVVDRIHGRPAVTRWRVLAREIDRTRVEMSPHTGRTHQLRLHAAAGLLAPILGDVLYGDGVCAPRLMLHATRQSFLEPGTGRRMEFESPAPF